MPLLFIALLLCIPIRIFIPALGTEIAPADFVCLFAMTYTIFMRRAISTWLLLSMIYAVLSVFVIQQFYQPGNLGRAILSLGFFFKPYWALYLGEDYAKRGLEPSRLNHVLICLLTLTALAAVCDAFFFRGYIAGLDNFERIPGEWIFGSVFGPTFFGLKFHGSNGVNGIAVFFSFAFSLLLALGFSLREEKNLRMIALTGAFACLILVAGSASRQAIFGALLALASYFFLGKMSARRLVWTLTAGVLAIGVCVMVLETFSTYFAEISAKLALMMNDISQGNWDGVTSGRLEIYGILLNDLKNSPVFGTGFSGYGLFDSDLGFFNAEFSDTGYTPHNQYLGALWKMGLLAGIPYIIFLLKTIAAFPAHYSKTTQSRRIALAMGIVLIPFLLAFNVFQDGLSSPSTGPFLMFILGFYRWQLLRESPALPVSGIAVHPTIPRANKPAAT